jgi:ATP-dependent protease ClpP protease subunit
MEQKSVDLAEIEIFGEIDNFWGIGPTDFKAAFDKVKSAGSIKLLLNSVGGSVFDGMSIYQMLAAHRDRLDVEVLGIAASIASIIALAGRKLTMAKGSFYMIHDPMTIMAGGADDLRKTADIMDKMKETFVEIYDAKAELGPDTIAALMAEETWYTAEEALDAGFADAVVDYGQIAARLEGRTVGQFTKAPEVLIVKSESSSNPRRLEDDLRDAGYSKADALAIVADGWKAVGRSESAPPKRSESAKKPGITPAMRIADINSRIRTPTP